MREEKQKDEYEHDSSDEEVRRVNLLKREPEGFLYCPVGFCAALSGSQMFFRLLVMRD